MRLLLDTHTLLWFIDGSTRLSPRARALIEDEANEVFLSVASLTSDYWAGVVRHLNRASAPGSS